MTLKSTKWLTVVGTVALCLFLVYLGQAHYLSHPESLQLYLKRTGVIAPVIFILIQIVQVIIPIIPGGVSSGIGVIVFGAVEGFLYNYVGLLIGSYIVFRLVKKYGQNFILKVTEKKHMINILDGLIKVKNLKSFFL